MNDAEAATFRINGDDKRFQAGTAPRNALALIRLLKLDPEKVVAEINGDIVRHADLEACVLQDGDTIEFVSFVGGG